MDKEYEIKYHNLEENHCWFMARREIIADLLKNNDKKSKILEIGCSGGPLLISLKKQGFSNVYGVDISEEAIKLCQRRGIENAFVMDGNKLNFKDKEFDIIIASDVLEHLPDEKKALSEWSRVLKSKGKMIIFVPAFKFLWSSLDEQGHHYRRYSKKGLERALREAGFRIKRISYWNFLLFFPTVLMRMIPKILGRADKQTNYLPDLNPLTNNLLLGLLRSENYLLKKINFPIGVSIFSVAEKE